MSLELTELEVRIREAVTTDDFRRAQTLAEQYTRCAGLLLQTSGPSDRGSAILGRHAAFLDWVRVSAATARAHTATGCALLARATLFSEAPNRRGRTLMNA
jgi:hypothetical protein